jgi:oxygen-independent coproporphyrinogen III oxidase
MNDNRCRHLYVHVPFCGRKCAYCAFYSERYSPRSADAFLEALEAELGRCVEASLPDSPTTVYIGGGTPSVLDHPRLARLLAVIRGRIDLGAVEEWTVECNPGTVTPEKLTELRNSGVTRVSLGAQAMADTVLAALGRGHDTQELTRAVRVCRAVGFTDIALDLIAGLPDCHEDAWLATLKKTLALHPTHISVYALTLESGTPLATAVEAGNVSLPDEDDQLRALATAEEVLLAAGFERYEISNYALPEHRCRHNAAYWAGRDYLGVGPAAASRVGCRRWTNASDIAAYVRAYAEGGDPPREEEALSPLTDAVERLAFGLRLAEGIPESDIAALPVAAEWLTALRRAADEGLVAGVAGRWRLTRRGRELADAVVRELMVV